MPFVQSINDLGLHHQLQARGVTTVVGALTVGEAYLLANHMHRNRVASHQVNSGPSAARSVPNTENPVVAQVTQMTLAAKVDQVTDMLAQLVAALNPPSLADNTCELNGPRAQSPGARQSFCWRCRRPGHFQRNCPLPPPGLNYDGPQMPPPPAGRL